MEAWKEDLYLQHGWLSDTASRVRIGVRNTANRVGSTIKSFGTKTNPDGTWKQHKYIRKEGNRYIYPQDLKKKVTDTANKIGDAVTRTANNVKTAAKNTYNKASTAVKNTYNRTSTAVKNTYNKTSSAAKSVAQKTRSNIKQSVSEGKKFVNKQLSSSSKKVSDFLDDWFGKSDYKDFENGNYKDLRFGVKGNGLNKSEELLGIVLNTVVSPFMKAYESLPVKKDKHFSEGPMPHYVIEETVIPEEKIYEEIIPEEKIYEEIIPEEKIYEQKIEEKRYGAGAGKDARRAPVTRNRVNPPSINNNKKDDVSVSDVAGALSGNKFVYDALEEAIKTSGIQNVLKQIYSKGKNFLKLLKNPNSGKPSAVQIQGKTTALSAFDETTPPSTSSVPPEVEEVLEVFADVLKDYKDKK